MKKIKYIVLLRGINAGGNNLIKMNELKILFEEMGFENVTTYIQNGNVIFDSPERDKAKLTKKIVKALSKKLDPPLGIVILTFPELKKIIDKKPEGFGENDRYKYNVFFLVEPLKAKEAIKEIKIREGVDNTYEGTSVVYFSYLISKRTKSYISKINELEIYPGLTIRNWNTTEKLYELMNEK